MGQKRTAGLIRRGGVWHIDKQIRGSRLRESTGESDLKQAEAYLAKRTEEMRQAVVYGVRPKRTFRAAATKYLEEHQDRRRIADTALHLKQLDPYIGTLPLEGVHMGSLRPFIEARQREGRKSKSINLALGVARHILNLAASEWLDERNLTWLQSPPKIKLLKVTDARLPYPLSWEEQARLFAALPKHLARMALFKVNTGTRDKEVCLLRWEWEVRVPELDTSVFIIPAARVKNGEERLVVLNRVARSVIDSVRGEHADYVFALRGRAIQAMGNSAWNAARVRVGLPQVRVHDLKHTFGRRLRAAGVSFEDRQDLLGHRSGRITTHYSAAELENLIAAAEKVCGGNPHKIPTMVLLKQNAVSGTAVSA